MTTLLVLESISHCKNIFALKSELLSYVHMMKLNHSDLALMCDCFVNAYDSFSLNDKTLYTEVLSDFLSAGILSMSRWYMPMLIYDNTVSYYSDASK